MLFEHGAIPKSAQEVAQNAEDDNLVVLETAKEQLGLLGADPDHPTGIVQVFAPVSGTITDQEITDQSAVQSYAAPNPFTISDLSHVWIICDVWENNMAQVHMGEYADIHLAAYPDRVLKGADQQHSAHHRSEHSHREGAAGSGKSRSDAASECSSPRPSTAKLWKSTPPCRPARFFTCTTASGFTRRSETAASGAQEVTAGNMLPDNLQEVVRGIKPGDQVVTNALVFQNTVEQ